MPKNLNKKIFKYLSILLIFLLVTSFISFAEAPEEKLTIITLSQSPAKVCRDDEVHFSWGIIQPSELFERKYKCKE